MSQALFRRAHQPAADLFSNSLLQKPAGLFFPNLEPSAQIAGSKGQRTARLHCGRLKPWFQHIQVRPDDYKSMPTARSQSHVGASQVLNLAVLATGFASAAGHHGWAWASALPGFAEGFLAPRSNPS